MFTFLFGNLSGSSPLLPCLSFKKGKTTLTQSQKIYWLHGDAFISFKPWKRPDCGFYFCINLPCTDAALGGSKWELPFPKPCI